MKNINDLDLNRFAPSGKVRGANVMGTHTKSEGNLNDNENNSFNINGEKNFILL